jgi:hypothetical protein
MSKWYAFTTDEIKTINATAVAKDYNRSISDEGIADLDVDATHIMRCVIADHTNWEGKFSIRAMGMFKMKGEEEPEMCFIDISHRDWKKLCSKRKFATASTA